MGICSHRKLKYGMSLEDYEQLLADQGGVCKICGGNRQPQKALGVDHDHTTGAVRGLLCGKCNSALGFMEDSVEWLQNLINHLKEANSGKSLDSDKK